MASGLLHHSESLLYNQTSAPPHRMVYALLGEFSSHRTHLLTFLTIAQPNFLTRLILLSTQVRLLMHSDTVHSPEPSSCLKPSSHCAWRWSWNALVFGGWGWRWCSMPCLMSVMRMVEAIHSSLSVVLQVVGYFVQGLLCLIYMPLCFQLARYTSEAASRVYADLTKDIDAGEVPDIAHAPVPAVSTVFYNLPVSFGPLVFKNKLHIQICNQVTSLCVLSLAWSWDILEAGCNVNGCGISIPNRIALRLARLQICRDMLAGECQHETGLPMYQG